MIATKNSYISLAEVGIDKNDAYQLNLASKRPTLAEVGIDKNDSPIRQDAPQGEINKRRNKQWKEFVTT